LRTIGVTGKYCAGKDTVTRFLVAEGFHEIDVDSLGHSALDEQRAAVTETFGAGVSAADGGIDRSALARVVFTDTGELRRLEAIVHPVMTRMVLQRIAEIADRAPDSPGVVVNAAVLFRMGLDHHCDNVLFVTAPLLTRVARARRRDGIGLFAALRRLRSQHDVDPQFSTSDADTCSVVNDGTRERLIRQVKACLALPDSGGVQWSNTESF
jgi:dephospho-CoA kinase